MTKTHDWITCHNFAAPDKLAQIDLASGLNYTYTQMHHRVSRVAVHLTELHVTYFLVVPAIYDTLKMYPRNFQTDFSILEHAMAGAEFEPDELVHWWSEYDVKIQNGFGMAGSSEVIAYCRKKTFCEKSALPAMRIFTWPDHHTRILEPP